jgi:hypothetical protein
MPKSKPVISSRGSHPESFIPRFSFRRLHLGVRSWKHSSGIHSIASTGAMSYASVNSCGWYLHIHAVEQCFLAIW